MAAERILVVDDEDSVRELVRDAMVEQGYQVWTAARGRDAADPERRRGDEPQPAVSA